MNFQEIRKIAWQTVAEMLGITEPTAALTGASNTRFLRGDASWSQVDLSTAAITGTLPVTNGGTGRATSTTAYALLAAGTTATGAHQTLAAGATTEILVGGGASALPAWTTATGSGAPVRATSPTLVTPAIGVATATSVNKVAVTAPATSATLTIADGQTLTVNGSATITNGTHSGTNTGDQTLASLGAASMDDAFFFAMLARKPSARSERMPILG